VGQPFVQQVFPSGGDELFGWAGTVFPAKGGDGIWALYPKAESKLFEQGGWQI